MDQLSEKSGPSQFKTVRRTLPWQTTSLVRRRTYRRARVWRCSGKIPVRLQCLRVLAPDACRSVLAVERTAMKQRRR
jgi:hypothetical protein